MTHRVLVDIVESYGRLRSVVIASRLDEDVSRLLLLFESGNVLLSAIADDDTIEIESVEGGHGQDVSAVEPWRDLLGASVMWAWQLVNQGNYPDGCQMQFRLPEGRDRCLQFVVAASSLHLSEVTPFQAWM